MFSSIESITRPGDRLIPLHVFNQLNLRIQYIESIPQLFSDSTHHLWFLHTTSGKKVLKCLNADALSQPFWAGVQALFGLDMTQHLADAVVVSQQLNRDCSLAIAQIEQAHNPTSTRPGYVVSKVLAGNRLHAENVTQDMVFELAQHITERHQQTRSHWGRFNQVDRDLTEWGSALQQSLQLQLSRLNMDSQTCVSGQTIQSILDTAAQIQPHAGVPIMLDLRWDQFLTDGQHLTALVDLDAFVFAPRELELVMLEYLLTDHQAWCFKQQYQQQHTWPDLTALRAPYRLWLFCLNVLGEADIQRWMNAPTRFDSAC